MELQLLVVVGGFGTAVVLVDYCVERRPSSVPLSARNPNEEPY